MVHDLLKYETCVQASVVGKSFQGLADEVIDPSFILCQPHSRMSSIPAARLISSCALDATYICPTGRELEICHSLEMNINSNFIPGFYRYIPERRSKLETKRGNASIQSTEEKKSLFLRRGSEIDGEHGSLVKEQHITYRYRSSARLSRETGASRSEHGS